jgi:hypothetical protein
VTQNSSRLNTYCNGILSEFHSSIKVICRTWHTAVIDIVPGRDRGKDRESRVLKTADAAVKAPVTAPGLELHYVGFDAAGDS